MDISTFLYIAEFDLTIIYYNLGNLYSWIIFECLFSVMSVLDFHFGAILHFFSEWLKPPYCLKVYTIVAIVLFAI